MDDLRFSTDPPFTSRTRCSGGYLLFARLGLTVPTILSPCRRPRWRMICWWTKASSSPSYSCPYEPSHTPQVQSEGCLQRSENLRLQRPRVNHFDKVRFTNAKILKVELCRFCTQLSDHIRQHLRVSEGSTGACWRRLVRWLVFCRRSRRLTHVASIIFILLLRISVGASMWRRRIR